MSEGNARIGRSLRGGLFGMLFAVALSGIFIGFLALQRTDYTGVVALVIVAVVGFAAGFWWDWRRAD